MPRTVLPVVLVLALILCAAPARAAGKVTLESLLRQMTDLSLLAEYPDPQYFTKQFSSYERLSERPGDDAWFANHDRGFLLYDGTVKEKTPYYKTGPQQGSGPDGHFAAGTKVGIARNRKPVGDHVWAYVTAADGGPIDGKIRQGYVPKDAITPDPQGHVLAEMDGPGCVVRIWSANPQDAGKVRIYLDDAKEPVIEAELTELLGGKWKTQIDGKEVTPFPDGIACERSRGYNLYFPIAYQKHCKVTVEKPDIYYHVNYRTYPKGTEIDPFSLESVTRLSEQVRYTANTLQGGFSAPATSAAVHGRIDWQQLDPGKKSEELTLQGEGKVAPVQLLTVNVKGFKDAAKALRGLVLVGRFDGAEEPQIWCPLGDFFGSGPGATQFGALPTGVYVTKGEGAEVSLLSRWCMPYEKSAVFSIENRGAAPAAVSMRTVGYGNRWTDRSMHFHAKWRTETMKTRPFRDWTYCDLKGRGVFVGDMLSILNPVTAWWGEGDEKIYVDGEKFPSWFGTGTEDYYGYAWSDPKPFQHAYHNQTRCDGPGTKGWTSVNRFHVLDAVPFEKSFRFDMEVWHWTPNIDVTYAATSYWYARPGATDDFKEPDAKTLQTIPELPPPYRVEGAIEGEKMKILAKSSSFDAGPQDMTEFRDGKWSGDSHLWVRPPKKGEWVDLELPVAADGKYQVQAYLTKARDYGIIQFHLDGKPLGKPADGFHPDKVVSTGAVDLGAVELKKGTATLRVEVVGTNDKSVGLRYMWGLDCVVLKPAAP
jgi:hypothetical protein